MRINTQETPDQCMNYGITVNGINVPLCYIVDTDEGYAICAFAINTKRGSTYPLTSYDIDNPYDIQDKCNEYTLHTFELWDMNTNPPTLVAKV